MILDKFVQQPGESRVRAVAYADWLGTGETLTGAVGVATLHSGSADDSGNPFQVSGVQVAADNTTVRYTAAGGAHGNVYKITFTITTNTPQTREDEILIRVTEV